MPYATNPNDHVRTFFEDSGGGGQPVLVYPGFTDPLEYANASPLAQALKEDFRLVFADPAARAEATSLTRLPPTP